MMVGAAADSHMGPWVTQLNGAITANSTASITVDSTAYFPSSGYVVIGGEFVRYTGTDSTHFGTISVVRGQANPRMTGVEQVDAAAHADNTKVETLDAHLISGSMWVNLIASGASFGSWALYVITGKVFEDFIKMVSWDYPWFVGVATIFRIPLFAISGAFLISFAIVLLQLFRG